MKKCDRKKSCGKAKLPSDKLKKDRKRRTIIKLQLNIIDLNIVLTLTYTLKHKASGLINLNFHIYFLDY